MKRIPLLCAGVCLALPFARTTAQESQPNAAVALGGPCRPAPGAPGCPTAPPTYPGAPTTPGVTPPGTPPGSEPSSTPGESFAQAPEAGTQAAASVAPAFFGDLISAGNNVFTPPILVQPGTPAAPAALAPSGNIARILAPEPWHAAYKIAENESPRPENRLYASYNYYNDVNRAFQPFGAEREDLHRETLGLEQTFFDGASSLGLRLPFMQLVGDGRAEDYQVGDLSLIFKHALYDDTQSGNLVSAGLLLTVPTGQELRIPGESALSPAVFQPFVGYIYNVDDFYVEGFSSVAVPTDTRDIILMFNSVALGYRLYSDEGPDAAVRSVTPQFEVHVNTPLNHRGALDAPVGFSDAVDLTGGVRVLFRRAEVGVAVGAPLTGPKPYSVEAMGNIIYHY